MIHGPLISAIFLSTMSKVLEVVICGTSIFVISWSELVPSIESLYHRDSRSRTVELIYINVSIKFSERGANQNKAIERKESNNLGQ